MKERLQALLENARIKAGELASAEEAEALRVKLLGKKGELTEILKSMKDVAPEERKSIGQLANEAKAEIDELLTAKLSEFRELRKQSEFAKQKVDVTEPGIVSPLGTKHIISITIDELTRIFASMGFSVAEGPEVETVFYNFDALNAGPNHPARDMTDTFYITKDVLLRTQTSPVQVRTLLAKEPPIRVIAP